MSTVASPSATNVCRALMSTPHWTSFEEACKHNSDMKSWNDDVKTLAENALKSHEGGEGLSIQSLKPFTEYALKSNEAFVSGLSLFKERIMKEEGASKVMKEAHEEMVEALGDQYIEISSHMMDFLSEIERFLMLGRNSHEYVARVIQQYLETETDKRDPEYYRFILEKLEELKSSDDVFEHSAESLLEKAEGLIKQNKEMFQKFKDDIEKLDKKVESAQSWNWKNITSTILTVTAVGLCIVGAVVAVVLDPPAAIVIAGFVTLNETCAAIGVGLFAGAGASALYWWEKVEMQSMKSRLEREKSERDETKVVIRELGDIKISIKSAITALESLLYPNSAVDPKHRENIDITMKSIEDKLNNFLNKINELENDVETCKKDTKKTRKEVYP